MTNWDQVEGEAKEKVGEVTDDESMGREGEFQEKWGDVKEKGDDVAEDVRERL